MAGNRYPAIKVLTIILAKNVIKLILLKELVNLTIGRDYLNEYSKR